MFTRSLRLVAPLLAAAALLPGVAATAAAEIKGVAGTTFEFTARADRIITPDGGSWLLWGYANGTGRAQYPGPTLIVNQGDTVTVRLKNQIAGQNVSLVFPGQDDVSATCASGSCGTGVLTLEALPGGASQVSYTFKATRAGTFAYHSGTRPDLQVEMGLTGALVVRPAGFDAGSPTAYGDAASAYDREYLFFLSEIDPRIHDTVEQFGAVALQATDYLSDYFSNYWFLNGRAAPDTMNTSGASLFPTQPYDSLPRMHPGERVLMRVVGGGSQFHPFHHHGNHARVIARDAWPLETAPGTKDLSYEVFTIQSGPGQTYDAIFTWTGKGLGWDMYGHTSASDPLQPHEDPDDHGKPFPITMPDPLNLVFGGFWSGSPFLGTMGTLPPGEGGLNPNSGYAFMWHSHTEKELTNFDVFPGGMMTMLIVEPPGVPIQ